MAAASALTMQLLSVHVDVGHQLIVRRSPRDPTELAKKLPKLYFIHRDEGLPAFDAFELHLTGKVSAGTSPPANKLIYSAGKLANGDKLFVQPPAAALTPASDCYLPGWSVRVIKPDCGKLPTMVP
eukprot:5985141-Pyramimonas_sp.AAC.1